MDSQIKQLIEKIFPEETKLREMNRCPICKEKVNKDTLKNELSKKEFDISGLCQKCQDSIFK